MKKVLILCNGLPPSEPLFKECRATAEYFIAADGGGNVARNFHALPDVVIGDMDSYEHGKKASPEIIQKPSQDTNDLEKALSLARSKQATHVQILGATGHRLDHTLKNLSVLKQFNEYFEELLLKDDYGDAFLIGRNYRAELPLGTQLSLFPLSGTVTGITTAGLKYPLSNESLKNGVRDGSSNEVVADRVEITHAAGDLLLFIVR